MAEAFSMPLEEFSVFETLRPWAKATLEMQGTRLAVGGCSIPTKQTQQATTFFSPK